MGSVELKVNDFFCGAGGMGLGFKQAGFRLAGAWDFDKYAVESYGNNISPKVKRADITQMTAEEVPYADVWTFGFPCQDLSVAGKQAGMIKGETRSGLFYEVMRLLNETNPNGLWGKPRIIMAENVKGLKKYLSVLEEEYKAAGYRMYLSDQNKGIFNSKYWGVPQNRERYFVIGVREDIKEDFTFPVQQTEFIPKLSSILETDVDEKYYIDDEKAKKIIEQAMKRVELKNTHACLTPDREEQRQSGRRAKAEEEEMFTLTSQDRHGVIIDDTYGYDGIRTYSDVSPTLRSSRQGLKVTEQTINCINPRKEDETQTYQQDRVYETNGIVPAVTSQLGGRMNVLEEPKINVIGMLDMKGQENIRRVYDTEGIAPTLTTSEGGHRQPKVLIPAPVMEDGTYYTVTTRTHAQPVLHGIDRKQGHFVFEHEKYWRVRKLTPREYARLQGFPESYKQLVSNSQFYKQMGNAVTVNVAKAMAEQIKEFLGGNE